MMSNDTEGSLDWVVGLCLGLLAAFSGAMGGILIRKSFSQKSSENQRQNGPDTSTGRDGSASGGNCLQTVDCCCSHQKQDLEGRTGDSGSRVDGDDAAPAPHGASGGDDGKDRPNLMKKPAWVAGLILTTVINPIGTVSALAFASVTLVTCMSGVQVLFNMLLAKLWLKEPATTLDYVGSVSVSVGMVLVIFFSGKDVELTSDEMYMKAMADPNAIAYTCTTTGIMLITLVFGAEGVARSLGSGSIGPAVQRLCLSLASGIAGGNSNLVCKAAVFALAEIETLGWKTVFSRGFVYVTWIVNGILSAIQIGYFNYALKVSTALFVVPTVNSVLIAIGAIGAIVVLHETPSNIPFFALGLVCVVGGIFCLTADEEVVTRKCKQCSTVITGRRDPAAIRTFVNEIDDHILPSLYSTERRLIPRDPYQQQSSTKVPESAALPR
eukprot:GHVU01202399.1.p1 GENE.GHVU01202399.1~~GHVU01202399.1.p1  ORF type:complete len:439 (+),score=35.59 GHVU01202399.1:229-1545(+)